MSRILRWGLPGLLFFVILTTVWAVPPMQERSPENLFQQTLRDIRHDLELLADFVFGGGERPEGLWLGNTDFTSESMLADLWLDNEQLADELYGVGLRPGDWIGATSRNADLVARNLRHDLEKAATDFFSGNLDVEAPVEVGPQENLRPDDWIGGPRITECSRTLMNIVLVLGESFGVRPTTPEAVRVYCPTLEGEIEDVLIDEALGAESAEQAANVPSLILAVRGDLERLADEVLGLNNRPPGWVTDFDVDTFTLSSDIFADQERLADILLGDGIRPSAWIGATRGSQLATFRNLRHDLELLTDIALGEGSRPNGWQGDSALFRCEPTLQTLVFLAERAYELYEVPGSQVGETGREYCREVFLHTNGFVENPVLPEPEEGLAEGELQFTAEATFAFAYLDAAAIQYMGVMPGGTRFRAWYRNFGASTMMFVSGEDFAVFIDRRWTTLDEDIFRRLPTTEGIRPLTFCDAGWCNGPSPTPTPTGSGPLLDIITANTPPAPGAGAGTPSADVTVKELVSWNNIRVNYLLQRQDVGRVQVSLEICRDAAQVACEPVLSVLDRNTGVALPIISQFNGLNVFELPYGYSTNFTIEGTLYYSEDIWLNDPTLTGP